MATPSIINKWSHSLEHHLLTMLESSFTLVMCVKSKPQACLKKHLIKSYVIAIVNYGPESAKTNGR